MTAHIRAITEHDFAAVSRLLAELGRPNVARQDEAAAQAVFQAHVHSPHTFSQLAEIAGEAVGFISLEIRPRLNWPTPEVWVPDLIVTEGARGTGAGHLLFETALEIAQQQGCHRLVLESGYARTVAHRFYEQHGLTNSGYYFTIDWPR